MGLIFGNSHLNNHNGYDSYLGMNIMIFSISILETIFGSLNVNVTYAFMIYYFQKAYFFKNYLDVSFTFYVSFRTIYSLSVNF